MALAKENIPEKDINVLTGRESLLFPLFFPLNQSTEDIDPHNNYSINRWTQHDPLSSMAWLQGASGLSVTNLNDLGDPRGHGPQLPVKRNIFTHQFHSDPAQNP